MLGNNTHLNRKFITILN